LQELNHGPLIRVSIWPCSGGCGASDLQFFLAQLPLDLPRLTQRTRAKLGLALVHASIEVRTGPRLAAMHPRHAAAVRLDVENLHRSFKFDAVPVSQRLKTNDLDRIATDIETPG
jgi:hypothetical protein